MDDPRPTEDLRTEALRPSDNLSASEEFRPDLRPMTDLRVNGAEELEPSATPKIMGAVVVALGVAALGAYTLSTGMWNSPTPPRMVALAEPAPVKITGPVAPLTPAPVSAPASPYQHAADTTTAKPPSRVAHVRKSEPVTNNAASAPSVPSDAATPATTPAPAPEPTPVPSTNTEPTAPAQPAP